MASIPVELAPNHRKQGQSAMINLGWGQTLEGNIHCYTWVHVAFSLQFLTRWCSSRLIIVYFNVCQSSMYSSKDSTREQIQSQCDSNIYYPLKRHFVLLVHGICMSVCSLPLCRRHLERQGRKNLKGNISTMVMHADDNCTGTWTSIPLQCNKAVRSYMSYP